MGYNLQGSAQIPLSVFGGQVSEMAPPNLPEGVSPDCPDVVFTPGGVRTRPALQKVFAATFPQGAAPTVGTVVWGKTFLTPAGGIENLYLDSNGFLWWEDIVNSPGAYTQIGTVTPTSYAKSVTALGREYLAISDAQHGSDAALQWDGANLDRVTQDGPGAAPTVANLALPPVAMAVSGAIVLTLVESDPANADDSGSFTRINTWTSSSVADVNPGASVTVAGYPGASAAMNGVWTVLAVYPGAPNSLIVLGAYLPSTTVFSVAAATGTVTTGTMVRKGNIVTVTTAAAHRLQVGYQAQITGMPAAAIGGGVSSIVINNENLPGIATVTMAAAHGLPPGAFVTLSGVLPVVGPNISAISRQGGIVTVTTATAHGLLPRASFTLAGVTNTTFNTTGTVLAVMSPTTFTFLQNDVDAVDSTGHTITNWPIPDTAAPQYFEVLSAPTSTTFQIQVNYGDGTWTTGTVTFAWDGTFYVKTVPSATSFTYQQNGPDASSSTVGTVTPFGQISPGQHQMRVSFLTRNGYLTKPSPPVTIMAPGGQYLSVSDLPIGPANVVARVLQFTGAQGAFFYYIPVAAQVNGQVVSTATQINDNVTTDAVIDFADNTLFAALGTSKEGNDLASQVVIDGALGFGSYASRIVTYGQRSRIQNLLNMGFDGGYLPALTTTPTGWSGAGGALVAGHFGLVWQAATGNAITQPCYQDAYGAPILSGNTKYKFRCWAKQIAAAPTVTATISSATTGFSSTVTLAVPLVFGSQWMEGAFSVAMPATIPDDMLLTVAIGGTGTAQLDDLSIVFAETPYVLPALFSYANNPEAFDGVVGVAGPKDDTHAILEAVKMDDGLHVLTQDPGGRIHRIVDNGTTEPAFWPVKELGSNCGVISAFGTVKSQADDSTASGGEEWFAWASASGARIFSGSEPWKISQEIEPDWSGAAAAGAEQWSSAPGINWAAQFTAWALNDTKARRLYFGLPTGAATAPNKVFVCDYRELDTAVQISNSAPIHTSYTGRLIATDHTRKWSPWNMTINGAALMARTPGSIQPVMFGGNGQAAGLAAGYGNAYTLNPSKFTDDDYGQINSYYVTYFSPSRDAEQAMQLGAGRKTLAFFTAVIAGLGTVTITPLVNTLGTPWSVVGRRALSANPTHDLEWPGGNAGGNRIAFKIQPAPDAGTDTWFECQRIMAAFRQAAHLPLRGIA